MQVREHFCRNVEGKAGVCKKRRQVFAEHLLTQNKTAISKCFHRLLVLKEPAKRIENDGRRKKAGDGTRTRDSLLGREAGVCKELSPKFYWYFCCWAYYEKNVCISPFQSSKIGVHPNTATGIRFVCDNASSILSFLLLLLRQKELFSRNVS